MYKLLFASLRTLVLICIVLIPVAKSGFALDLDPNEIRGTGNNKQPVSVLQNRFFTKSMRSEFGVIGGKLLNESYTDTMMAGLRGALFISEWIGIEAQYVRTNVSDSDDRRALNQIKYRSADNSDSTVKTLDPEVNPIHQIFDTNVIAAPFYGKLNLLDKFIVYSDLYALGGVSKVDTDQGSLNAFSLGAGQRFYFLNNTSFRIEFRDRTYVEQRSGQSSRKHALCLDFGASYFL